MNLLRIFLYFISAVFVVNSIVLTGRKSFTLGLAIMVAIAAVSFVLARYFDFWVSITDSGIGMITKYVILFSLLCFVFLAGYVLSYAHSTVTYKEDAIIVLGAAVHGKTPSRTLRYRLKKAVDYHEQNPDAIIIVSGGQGAQEDISEAEAMKIYLVENGVASNKIIKEDKSTSTAENFKFSKEILDETFCH